MEKYSPTKGHLLVSPLPTKPQALSESSPPTAHAAESQKAEKSDQPRSSSNTPASRGRGGQLLKKIPTSRTVSQKLISK